MPKNNFIFVWKDGQKIAMFSGIRYIYFSTSHCMRIRGIIWMLVFPLFCTAQTGTIKGKVTSESGAVPFAHVGLEETEFAQPANDQGCFELAAIPPGEYSLYVSAVGYKTYHRKVSVRSNDTLVVKVTMTEFASQLGEVVVTGTMKETFIEASPVKVEVITPKFLQAHPTNNVIEALQTVNGVQEQINCGVCGTNDIHINGMEGPYTLVLIDGMPIMSALATVYGFNGIPTSLIRRVEIIKGPSSTLYGTEAVGGVINIITKRPEDLPLVTLHSYYTSHREWDADVSWNPDPKGRSAFTFSGNMYRNQYRMDFNHDNFTDIPLNERGTFYAKWSMKRVNDRVMTTAARLYGEERFGGSMNWQPADRGSNAVYGEHIYTRRVEVIGQYQLPLQPYLRIDYSFNRHMQDSYYGHTRFKADQRIAFANLLWMVSKGNHSMVAGMSNKLETYQDNTPASVDGSKWVKGVFVQDEWSPTDVMTWLIGARLDHHREHGLIFAPRLGWKQQLATYTTLRVNLGTGFREVQLFTEDHAALTGAREVVVAERIRPESSYNANLNVNHALSWLGSSGSIDMDVFYTWFTNKIVPDYGVDENLIVYANLNGHGISRGAAFQWHHQIKKSVTLNIGGTFQDVYEMTRESGELKKEVQLFTPLFSGTFSAGYEWKQKGWSLNITGKIMGPQHLPHYEPPFTRAEQSPWYVVQHVQVTKKLPHRWECFFGVKNIWNYTQDSPLIDPEHPFGDHFDTSYAYGPLQVRRFFAGFRWSVERKMK
ncbi:MAG: TonB-dependent receptor [Flavobacteriales bacterium]|nr:TonB-dependent receptor [Flavobacteriales bacterium]MCB9447978.1 TonB-dependent receptor [Flavobacteriales bacterium]